MTATVLCLEPEVENCLAAAATRGFWNLENMLSRLLRSAVALWGGRRGRSKVTDAPAKWTTWMQLKGVFSGVTLSLYSQTWVSGQVMEIKRRYLMVNVPDCSENQQSYKQRDMPIEGSVKIQDNKFVSNYCSAT